MSPIIQAHQIDIHNFHLDGYGHVNNARYLEFLEAARWHYFQQLGYREILRQLQLVVAHIDIAYRQAARQDDVLAIHTSVLSVQSRRLVLQQTVQFSGSLKMSAQAKVSLMPTQNGQVFRFPDDLLRALQAQIDKE